MHLYLVRYPALTSIYNKWDCELTWGLRSVRKAKNVS